MQLLDARKIMAQSCNVFPTNGSSPLQKMTFHGENEDLFSHRNHQSKGQAKKKMSWKELQHTVHSARKLHAKFANMVPHQFAFVPCVNQSSSDHIRVVFLGVLPGQSDRTLLYVDVPATNSDRIIDNPPKWKQVFENFQLSHNQLSSYSKEEELFRERKRLSFHGITSFQIDSSNTILLFPTGGSLFTMKTCDIGRNDENGPTEIPTNCKGARMDPKLSPNDPTLVAFIYDNDVWLTSLTGDNEQKLTYVHSGETKPPNYPVSAGVASYIVQEEFDRYTGYWWQPATPKGLHRIVFEVVDESNVSVLHVANPMHSTVDQYRYPKPGSPNADVSLRLLEFTTAPDGKITDRTIWRMSRPLNSLFPWMEYIVRVEWIPDGRGIWVWMLDRAQQRSAVVFVPTSHFDARDSTLQGPGACNGDDEMVTDVSPSSLSPSSDVKVLYEESSSVWINVHNTYHFFTTDSPEEINFIWASEQTGFRHLYHVNAQLKKPNNAAKRLNTGDLISASQMTDESLRCDTTITPLTTGQWEVLEAADSMWVDEANQQVYFMALKESVLESNLYKISLETPSKPPVRLMQPGCSHSVSMSKDCRHVITTSSSIADLYSVKHYTLSPHPVATTTLLEPIGASEHYTPPELFSFTNSSGDVIHGFYHKPADAEPDRKYPTVLYVYGGPHVQLATNAFKVFKHHRLYTLAAMGYVVVAIDGRGSTRRGLAFESHLQHKMGQVEISDQVEGLNWLARNVGLIDLSRIAVHGWSYGGYLSLMALAQRPDVFKIAVAGAPVVRWEDYDTGYTERYMSTPDLNPDGYQKGSVLSYVDRLPNEPNRLLLVHGLIDENVHFAHTTLLIHSLVRQCKPHQLQVYPSERHGIRSLHSNEHFEVAVISFLQQHL